MVEKQSIVLPRTNEHAGEVLRKRQLLEDQLFKRIKPRQFERTRQLVNTANGRVHARVLQEMVDELSAVVPRDRIVHIESRIKHLFSIYRKLRRKRVRPEEIYDLFGLRVICATNEDCRFVVDMIHELYRPVPGRFKDYIASPKSTGYRSIHTTVHGPSGHSVEVQVRTLAMHFQAEADHTDYKQEARFDDAEHPWFDL